MVAQSKLFPPEMGKIKCQKILHPWTNSCFLAYLDLMKDSVIGSAGFLALMYLFQYLLKVVKKTNQKADKNFLLECVKNHLRSLVFCCTVSSMYMRLSCSFHKLLGRFSFYTIVMIPAMIAGLGISIESPKNKALYAITWANMVIEVWIKHLEERKLLKWSNNHKTMIFMVLSAILSHFLHKDLPDQRYFWFFVPKKSEPDGSRCYHDDTCQKHLFTHFMKYFTTGFGIQYLKIIFSSITKPKVLLYSLLDYRTYKLGAFLGFYVLIHQLIRCFLYQRQKKFSNYHDIIAGFLAGSAFRFQPNISIFNTAITTFIQILTRLGCEKKILPKLPYNDLVWAVCNGILFHTRIFTPHHSPKLMTYIMSATTNGKSDYVTGNYQNFIRQCFKVL